VNLTTFKVPKNNGTVHQQCTAWGGGVEVTYKAVRAILKARSEHLDWGALATARLRKGGARHKKVRIR